MKVPGKLWGEAASTAVYLLNRAPIKSLNGKTPYEAWFGRKPGVKHLRTFGCTAYAKKLGPSLTKLTDRAVPGIFLGYESGSKGYRVFDPVKGRLMISRDVLFDEKKVCNWGESEQGDEATTVPMHTFTVELPDTIPGPTIEQDAELGAESSSNGAVLHRSRPHQFQFHPKVARAVMQVHRQPHRSLDKEDHHHRVRFSLFHHQQVHRQIQHAIHTGTEQSLIYWSQLIRYLQRSIAGCV